MIPPLPMRSSQFLQVPRRSTRCLQVPRRSSRSLQVLSRSPTPRCPSSAKAAYPSRVRPAETRPEPPPRHPRTGPARWHRRLRFGAARRTASGQPRAALMACGLPPAPVRLRRLADDARRILIAAQSEISRMAELSGLRPLGETDLCDQFRLDPVHAGPRQPAATRARHQAPVKWRVPSLELAQRTAKAGEGGLAEAGSDLACVGELAGARVIAEQQRAEMRPRPLRVGITADQELLTVLALELQPVASAPGPVGRVRPL